MIEETIKDEYLQAIQSKLDSDRYIHSLKVAESAVTLAEKYGADVRKAYVAGVLHDVMKNSSVEDMLLEIKNAGYTLSSVEKNNPKLWHAIAGAAFIKNKLNIKDEEIISAVLCHTTAKKDMSLLDKVIYIADFISKDRNYNGVEEVRKTAFISLEKTMMICLQFTVHDLSRKKQLIHPNSIDAYNQLIIQNNEEVSK